MAKRGGRSGRKYVRDSIGRFATTGATARGGRLKTKSGKKRATQTVKAKTGSKPAGAIKGKIKRDPGAAKPAVAKTAGRSKTDLQRMQQADRIMGKLAKRQKAVVDKAPSLNEGLKQIRRNNARAGRVNQSLASKGLLGKYNRLTAPADPIRMTPAGKGIPKTPRRAKKNVTANSARAAAKPAAAKPATARKARIDGDAFAARAKKARGTELRRYINEGSRRDSLSSAQRVKTPLEVRQAASQKREAKSRSTASRAKAFYQNFGSPSTFSRRDRKSTRDSDRFGSKRRGAKKKRNGQ